MLNCYCQLSSSASLDNMVLANQNAKLTGPDQGFLQPRSQALSSCGAKTLVGAGHVTHRKLIAQEGDGKVSYYMFPLSHFALRLQGVAVLYNHL